MVRPLGLGVKYRPEMCQKMFDMLKEGALDCELYAALGIAKATFQRWREKYPKFKEAYEEGMPHCEAYWTAIGRRGMMGEIKGFNFSSWIAFMNNKFKWAKDAAREAQNSTNTQINIGNMSVSNGKTNEELIQFIQSKLDSTGIIVNDTEYKVLPEPVDQESEGAGEDCFGSSGIGEQT